MKPSGKQNSNTKKKQFFWFILKNSFWITLSTSMAFGSCNCSKFKASGNAQKSFAIPSENFTNPPLLKVHSPTLWTNWGISIFRYRLHQGFIFSLLVKSKLLLSSLLLMDRECQIWYISNDQTNFRLINSASLTDRLPCSWFICECIIQISLAVE